MADPKTIDIEKGPVVTTTTLPSVQTSETPSSPSGPPMPPLEIYKALIGDVLSKPDVDPDSLYWSLMAKERSARNHYLWSAFSFWFLILSQIVLCLAITVGSQTNYGNPKETNNQNITTIAAAINTVVASGIAALKGLGLPDKKALERHKFGKLAENIRYTTRRLRVGINMDAVAAADDVRKLLDDLEDEVKAVTGVELAKAVSDELPAPKVATTSEKKE